MQPEEPLTEDSVNNQFLELTDKELRAIGSLIAQNTGFVRGVVHGRRTKFYRGKFLSDSILSADDEVLGNLKTEDEVRELIEALLMRGLMTTVEKVKDKKESVKTAGLQLLKPRPDIVAYNGTHRYIFHLEEPFKMNVLFIVASVAIVAITCFPIWPLFMRVGVWYLAVTILIAIFGLILVRYLVFTFCWMIGLEIWIFPNLFDEEASFVDSFKPVLTVQRSTSGQWIIRLILLGLLSGFFWWVYTQPTEAQLMFEDFVASQRKIVSDLYEGKLLSDTANINDEPSDTPSKVNKGYKSLDEILEETESFDDDSSSVDETTFDDLDQDEKDIMAELRAENAESEAAYGRSEDER